MNCKFLNDNIKITDYLAQKNKYPISVKQNIYWYLSPFRFEKTSSFKVDNSKNLFYDFGEGFGGTLIDLIIKLENITVKEIIYRYTNNSFSFQQQKNNFHLDKTESKTEYEILDLKEITSFPLIQYLNKRKISIEIAKRYCKEIHYKLNHKTYYAIAFPNNQNGFEIRNKYVKMCLVKKEISLIKNNQKQLKIFESWSDFISYIILFSNEEYQYDFMVLNSISLLRRNINLINKYEAVQTYLDHDNAGRSSTNFIISELKNKVKDESFFYKNYKDLNEFLLNEIRIK